ncbi:DNA alkylation repair protein [Sphingomonas sp. NPDC092331]|uniref:DNA alkylation repair protein n=1 Tax=unclassified Sphingomonas TaxID=196159 RepID=UPI0031F4F397
MRSRQAKGPVMEPRDAADCLARLTRLLEAEGEPRRAAAAQRDKGSRYHFLAIRVPVLRRIALSDFDLSHHTPDARLRIFDYIWTHSEEYEVLSVPLLYYRNKGLAIRPEDFEVIRGWVGRVDDWGHCDDLSAIYSYCNHNWPERVMPFLRRLNGEDDIWSIRTSIVALVHYSGKNAVYLRPDQVFPFLDPHLGNRNNFIANAVGWVLREMHNIYPREIEDYIRENAANISSVARRKARL